MTSNNTLSFSILSSHCWVDAAYIEGKSPASDTLLSADFNPIELKQIPAIKRRRLNGISKMAMHSSLKCLEKASVDPSSVITVFASQHGELNRTVSIVDDMVNNQEVSPKDFSLSVHNAALGLFSIFNKNKHPGTSIAANTNTFGYGLIEALNLLHRFPDCLVLLTCFDSQVNPPFQSLQSALHPSHSYSLLLSAPDSQQYISMKFNKFEKRTYPELPLELQFFNFLQNDVSSTTIRSEDTDWEFTKHAL
ncbi:beta-ketoacyl synthase chain length factor [Kangiella sediminilitoris]|uniref:Beta-ketoacyl synthase-like N-terminal domain-containing protein n=1 Tax=Kangiella sediminilitoris TaxID=1144748 RepID=A0A1B3BDT1_9GAMM|nr:beta-ketoacyl synthase chain length factor [Kangiella sediminilitoris]AOE50971.1 hypothetical protein KS2013_2267 [Kangiella sediminilitoris]